MALISPILDDRSFAAAQGRAGPADPGVHAGVDRPQRDRSRHRAAGTVRVPRRVGALPVQPDPRDDEDRISPSARRPGAPRTPGYGRHRRHHRPGGRRPDPAQHRASPPARFRSVPAGETYVWPLDCLAVGKVAAPDLPRTRGRRRHRKRPLPRREGTARRCAGARRPDTAADHHVLRHDPAGSRPERPGRRTARRLDHAGPVAVDRGAAQEEHRPARSCATRACSSAWPSTRRSTGPSTCASSVPIRHEAFHSDGLTSAPPADAVAALERPGSRRDHARGRQRYHPRPGHQRSRRAPPAAPATRPRHPAAAAPGTVQPTTAGRREAGRGGRGLDQRQPPAGRPPQRRDPQGALGRTERGPGRAVPGSRAPSCSVPGPATPGSVTRSRS